jgi:hypothetical protein
MMRMAVRSKVKPTQPKVRPLANAEHVVGIGRGFLATRNATQGMSREERGAHRSPCRIIATLGCARALGVVLDLTPGISGTLALAPLAGGNGTPALTNAWSLERHLLKKPRLTTALFATNC